MHFKLIVETYYKWQIFWEPIPLYLYYNYSSSARKQNPETYD